jgi:hypothetical protein
MIWPTAKRGRPRKRHIPDVLSKPAEDTLAAARWQTISWRTGTKGKLKARFAAGWNALIAARVLGPNCPSGLAP